MYEILQLDSLGSKPVSYFIEKFPTLPFVVLSVYWAQNTKKAEITKFQVFIDGEPLLSVIKKILTQSEWLTQS